MKKIISLILAMAMCLSLCVQTFAKENDGVNVENVPEMMGILRTDDGKEYTIKGVLVSVAPMSRAANDACSATYRYDLPVSPQANDSTTESDHDGAAASTVYLTIHYTHRNTPTEYLLTRVSGYWEISAQKVSVESAKLSYGCSGTFPSPTTQSVTDISVNNYFDISTGFTDYVVPDVLAVMGANLTVNYLMGTSRRWSFTLTNNLFNNMV